MTNNSVHCFSINKYSISNMLQHHKRMPVNVVHSSIWGTGPDVGQLHWEHFSQITIT